MGYSSLGFKMKTYNVCGDEVKVETLSAVSQAARDRLLSDYRRVRNWRAKMAIGTQMNNWRLLRMYCERGVKKYAQRAGDGPR